MQLSSGGAVTSLPTAFPGQNHTGDQENSKAIEWLIIYLFLRKI